VQKGINKVLYVALHYDYGRKEQGLSFEFNNFYPALKKVVPEVIEFDFATIMQESGRSAMNAKLLETADRIKPDLIFFVLFENEFDFATLEALSKRYMTFNWFCDDHWRFDNFSNHFAPAFSYVSTTDRNALQKYDAIGYKNALMTQWACNHLDYVMIPNTSKRYDVTFVGQAHGSRKFIMSYLGLNGIKVATFGRGWKNGRITQSKMIEIFNESKINLNLSNASWNIYTLFRRKDQIKGRNFEVPGCGSFLLTNYVQGLENYFDLDKEMICFRSMGELIEKTKYYLKHDDEREGIANRAYRRTLREHTFEGRFRRLFEEMGFSL
jgi:spore maturation protein CgeB